MRHSAAVKLNVRMADACGLSDFRCSVAVGARHVAPESDSLLRFGTLPSQRTVIHKERGREKKILSGSSGNSDQSSLMMTTV